MSKQACPSLKKSEIGKPLEKEIPGCTPFYKNQQTKLKPQILEVCGVSFRETDRWRLLDQEYCGIWGGLVEL